VPAGMVEVARRLCEDNQIRVGEIWSYHAIGDQPRFALVHRDRDATGAARARAARPAAAPRKTASRGAKPLPRRKPTRATKAKKSTRASRRK
ncbi:MAG: hypothetical protein HY047_16810, partial [Acidobacteria bacterium]|nr:hypothetical protein [Acidobacteriota bacterium]